ncbi:MAG: magnesium/cobalt transporter CorA [Flavobacterium sp.]|nr:magnesium/cobalt transporter CorA [Pedobacter sp.]
MGLIKRTKIKSNSRYNSPGSSPGLLEIRESDLKPKIKIYAYLKEVYSVYETEDFNEIEIQLNKNPASFHWVDVQGLGDIQLFQFLENKFKIHKLVLEDIMSNRQRPKLDEYDDYLFSVSRLLVVNKEKQIQNDQVGFLLMPQVLISFQSNYNEFFAPVINNLKQNRGNIRLGGTSYMLYALTDLIVDNYFELIYKLGDELETIEELLYRRPNKTLIYDIQSIKRAMIVIRRVVWPERDKVNDLIRSSSKLISRETRTYLRDTYDHTMQVIDLIESNRDITTGLIDMNLSFISNRMNEIMKVLTIISSIFIPLTFVAGVYGMNFSYQDPETGKVLHNNMPELYAENGYMYTMLAMLAIAIVQIIYFYRKGWLSNR